MGLGAGMMGLENVLRAPMRTAIIAALLVLGALTAAAPASAQDSIPPPPMPSSIDERGVDLISGKLVVGSADLAIGPSDHRGLTLSRQWVNGTLAIRHPPLTH